MSQLPVDSRPRPHSLSDLFFSFTLLALQGFGGVLAIVQRELIDRKQWLTTEEFVEDWAVAQILPGPNVINLSMMVGNRYFGLAGALTALAGLLTVPLILVLLLAMVYAHWADHPGVAGALRGMSAVTAGLIFASGLKLLPALKRHPLGQRFALCISAFCFVCIALLRLPLVYVLLVLGPLVWFLVYRKLDR
ncbi:MULTISPECIES: chromate transporter [unclassified Undibacterium]|uniref:chromate transporter n=1 Tax=unclassified Undibacterium TaxID=2630295 RepID=UPI002AC91A2D|nr:MULTISPECIES: chromate transporter [unclassified Undibacterium]MEB0137785.1 chromate transporter [Undibacterium sp. CCC2.1]MEB0171024.1 chromate transporter [Undibacterium sp. CCC1.1]MEB0175069.1 chromate transporter [Undibacterium sp. CCC3.4]MEB0215153.1 chromate transporter [Undibacterium sp. 5I2]WPX44873.1 chromate transporter [Undibacterium sp. CCC3.4]